MYILEILGKKMLCKISTTYIISKKLLKTKVFIYNQICKKFDDKNPAFVGHNDVKIYFREIFRIDF